MRIWTLTTENPDGYVTTAVATTEEQVLEAFGAALEGWVEDEVVDALDDPAEAERIAREQGSFLTVELVAHELRNKDDDLALWFTPDAIREHFADGDDDPTEGLSDEQLREAGEIALDSQLLYREFHDALAYGIESLKEA